MQANACPVALPIPADAADVACKADANGGRCGGGLSYALCKENNDRALARGLITQDAYNWLQSNGFCAVNVDGVHSIIAICPVGCFAEDTSILTFNSGDAKWKLAKNVSIEDQLAALGYEAPLSSPSFDNRSIKRLVHGDEEADLYVFHLSNGHRLRVTQHHGMVLADGRVVEARNVKASDLFVGLDGSDVEIEKITRQAAKADVYNFLVNADAPQEHVIVAEGVLVGDLAWQSTRVEEMDSIRLRR